MKLLYFFFLLIPVSVFAHSVEQYVKTKDNVTLYAIITRESKEERKMMDGFLNHLVGKLKRNDRSVPIYLLADQFSFYNETNEWFASIAYDSLKSPDPFFIENYLFYRMGSEYREHLKNSPGPIMTKHQIDLPEPVDLGASYENTPIKMGLKIIYDYGESDSLTGWDRMYTLVQYAIDQIEEIKKNQKRMVLTYRVPRLDTLDHKTDVSILTIDTGMIRKIPLLVLGFDPENIDTNKKMSSIFWIAVVIIIIALVIFFVLQKKK